MIPLNFRENFSYDTDTSLRLLPAGHIFGSAMVHVTRPEGSLLYTGDFKLRSGLTAEAAEPNAADTLLMESTFGQPFFRFPSRQVVTGLDVGPYRAYQYADFHGPGQLALRERGVLVAPMHLARSGFCTQFANPCRFVLTGWALLKNAIYRYGVEHALPLSDHADFDELLEMIERVQPKKFNYPRSSALSRFNVFSSGIRGRK